MSHFDEWFFSLGSGQKSTGLVAPHIVTAATSSIHQDAKIEQKILFPLFMFTLVDEVLKSVPNSQQGGENTKDAPFYLISLGRKSNPIFSIFFLFYRAVTRDS